MTQNTKSTLITTGFALLPIVGSVAFGIDWNASLASSITVVVTAILKHFFHANVTDTTNQ